MLPGDHDLIENTIPSMAAAFAAGADVVELDVHLTPDGEFAVFHDWTLDCRTNGSGVTEAVDMAVLKTLDVGYGYTADDGRTFPLRGTAVGAMPTLKEVFAAFPDRKFLVNFKSRRVEEGEVLASMLADNPQWSASVFGVYGAVEPVDAARDGLPGLAGYDRKSVLGCLLRYEAVGWSGFVPKACRHSIIVVPINYARALWGWPDRFLSRMRRADTAVILTGPYKGGGFTTGIDAEAVLNSVPAHFDGYVWTNRVESIGPLIRPEKKAAQANSAATR